MKKQIAVASVFMAVVALAVFMVWKPGSPTPEARAYVDPRSAEAQQATKERMQAQGLYGSGQLAKAESTLTEFVARLTPSSTELPTELPRVVADLDRWRFGGSLPNTLEVERFERLVADLQAPAKE